MLCLEQERETLWLLDQTRPARTFNMALIKLFTVKLEHNKASKIKPLMSRHFKQQVKSGLSHSS